MAGNTKLVGFSPRPEGVGGVINLERWGDRIAVEVSEESVQSIRDACTKLPGTPPEQRNDNNGFVSRYNESVGRVHVDVDPYVASDVANILETMEDHSSLTEAGAKAVRAWVHSLRKSVKAHVDYRNAHGEPGVEDPA